ncbi:MAG: hypothetical protein ABFD79_05320 [Phycisphaerales bacterium]
MTNTKHTPAPWNVGSTCMPKSVDSNYLIHSANSISIAEVYKPNDKFRCREYNADVSRANARLIAAAPELLQALEEILIAFSDSIRLGGENAEKYLAVQGAALAIAKAKGE